MKNISNIHDCYGCGVCATVCPQKIIDISLNADGFYEPHISDEAKCTDCGLCRCVCSYCDEGLSLKNPEIYSYAAWSKVHAVRRKCSSGGVGFEVGRTLINEGYKVCGVRYNAEKNIAEHYIATTVEELIPSIGSKYIQSYTVDGFKAIDCKQKYLVTGTPCQIDSLRRYLQLRHKEENFILMDFFCHGVPSMLMWRMYCSMVEDKIGKISYASWRNKQTGWHDSWAMGIDGEEHGQEVNWHDSYSSLLRERSCYLQSRMSQGDAFYALFLGNCCLGKACYEHCKFKYDHSSADIRIGDLWGEKYKEDEDGVSAAIAFTPKGSDILSLTDCELTELPFKIVAEGQMKEMPKKRKSYKIIMEMLHHGNASIEDLKHKINSIKKIERRMNYLKNPMILFSVLLKKCHRNVFLN
ncbi:MAG: Coenzyme F420 hydrogenase/dehydrogenase, beta subunit C-terminal domain [Paludibacteraceae bacterium]|nr:Coenzyme F420 hydrogenase/dehydrogenase, beta subunit C-terminal domain [Paludibacteraceae bacterium]HOI27602.1 Coenzyme F420 hydrogenase/dehydrogenase, beta subunit C-terminal domain [Paludibacteraceae bacterium]